MCDFRIIEKNFVNDARKCVCKNAVLKAYKGLAPYGHQKAMAAAMKIYHFHHPEDSAEDNKLTVETWVLGQVLH